MIELVNLQALEALKLFADEDPEALVQELIQLYLNQSSQDIQTIQNSVREKQVEQITQLAHRLKSSSMQMGVIAVSKKAAQLERVKGDINPVALEALVTELVDDFEKSKVILLDYFKKLKI